MSNQEELDKIIKSCLTPELFAKMLEELIDLYSDKSQYVRLEYLQELKGIYLSAVVSEMVLHARKCDKPQCLASFRHLYGESLTRDIDMLWSIASGEGLISKNRKKETPLNEKTREEILAELKERK